MQNTEVIFNQSRKQNLVTALYSKIIYIFMNKIT